MLELGVHDVAARFAGESFAGAWAVGPMCPHTRLATRG